MAVARDRPWLALMRGRRPDGQVAGSGWLWTWCLCLRRVDLSEEHLVIGDVWDDAMSSCETRATAVEQGELGDEAKYVRTCR